jgi:hypothetical protein
MTLLAAALLLLAGGMRAAVAQSATPNEVARVLAGLPPSEGSPLSGLAGERVWQRHAEVMDAAWANIETRQLSKIRAWTASELASPNSVLYYP